MLQEEGSQLESQESMMPDVLKPGQDLHVQVSTLRTCSQHSSVCLRLRQPQDKLCNTSLCCVIM